MVVCLRAFALMVGCLLVCLIAGLVGCVIDWLFQCLTVSVLIVRLCVCLRLCSLPWLIVCQCYCLFLRLFACLFV